MKKTKLKKIILDIFDKILYYSCIFFFFLPLVIGLHYILNGLPDTNYQQYLWNFISLAFLVGTLILTINPERLGIKSNKILGRIGFGVILSCILIFFGYGFAHMSPTSKFIITITLPVVPIGAYITIAGELLFSLCLAFFIVELARGLFSKK